VAKTQAVHDSDADSDPDFPPMISRPAAAATPVVVIAIHAAARAKKCPTSSRAYFSRCAA
jgi:hypothetical protein